MIKPVQNLQAVKDRIKSFYEKDVSVKVNLGRNRIARFDGKLSGVYPALFTVSPFDKNYRGRTAYTYSEILCGNVKICGRVAPVVAASAASQIADPVAASVAEENCEPK